MPIQGFSDFVEIGRGGFAVVYRAHEAEFGRDVAVKVFNEAVGSETMMRRLSRERQALGRLGQHPHIVGAYDTGTLDDGRPYLVMPYMRNGSLVDILRTRGPLPWPEVLSLGIDMTHALTVAHAAGILHRDIKPDNVLFDEYGAAQLADFGLARLEGLDHTATGVVTATIAYAAPEILDGRPPAEESDVYSLGATLFAALTGHPPFHAADAGLGAAEQGIFAGSLPDLRPEGAPARLCDILDRSLAKDPRERFGSAETMWQALIAARPDDRPTFSLGPSDGSRSPRTRRRGHLVSAIVVVATAIALVVGIILWPPWPPPPSDLSTETSTTPTTTPTTTSPPTTTRPPVDKVAEAEKAAAALPPGLLCRNLRHGGHDYETALAYWRIHGRPNASSWDLDQDDNGIPCETVYTESERATAVGPM